MSPDEHKLLFSLGSKATLPMLHVFMHCPEPLQHQSFCPSDATSQICFPHVLFSLDGIYSFRLKCMSADERDLLFSLGSKTTLPVPRVFTHCPEPLQHKVIASLTQPLRYVSRTMLLMEYAPSGSFPACLACLHSSHGASFRLRRPDSG